MTTMLDKLREQIPNYRAGYINPWCVGCGILGPMIPTQQFIVDWNAEYHCGGCIADRNLAVNATPKFVLDNVRLNILHGGLSR